MSNGIYWPGTNIIKSQGNDFDWRANKTEGMSDHMRYLRQSHAGVENVKKRMALGKQRGEAFYLTPVEKPYQRTFTTYSKAVPSRGTK